MLEYYNKDQLTTSTREHLTIRAELDAVHRTMVAFEHLTLFACNVMYAHPFITGATRDEAILQDWVNRSGGWRVRKR